MTEGMGTSDLYGVVALGLSLFALALSVAYLRRVIHSYRYHHDDRAAVALAKAIGLTVISVGLIVSASGLITDRAELSVAGLSLSRGALLVLLATLLLANVRPQSDDV